MCTKIGTIVKWQDGRCTILKVKCKSWSCPDCSKERRKRLIAEAMAGHPNRFITLTVNPAWFTDPAERAAKLAAAWRTIRKAYRKRWPTAEAEFLTVFEATERGEPHLHIMWRGGFVPQKWLSMMMRKLMGAPIVDVRMVRSGKKVAEYVSKYISKRSIRFGTCKRYWRSKGYLHRSKRSEFKAANKGAYWYRLDCHWKSYVREVLRRGYKIDVEPTGALSFRLSPSATAPPWCLTETPSISR